MASISSAGLGSGLDVNSLVEQLVAAEGAPAAARLDRQEAMLQARLTAFGQLKGALSAFQTAVGALALPSRFQSLTANSADATVYTASAAAGAVTGSYAIEVKQLAQAHKLASGAFTDTTETIGTGTLTFQFGTWSDGVFTNNPAKPAQTVTIEAGNQSLAGVRDAINGANIGVSATIVNDGTGDRLVLASKDTGAANSLRITVADDDGDDTDAAGLSRLAYDPAGSAGNGKNLIQTVAAQDALLEVDGIDGIRRASNTITDVIEGVTLQLLRPSADGVATTLNVGRDTSVVRSAVEQFIQAYNDLQQVIRNLSRYDVGTRKASALQGDAVTASVLDQIRSVILAPIPGASGAYNRLSQIGVGFQSDGRLALDAAVLNDAIARNADDIAGLFAARGRATDSLVSYVSSTSGTAPGTYAITVSQLAERGYLRGAGTAALGATAGTFDEPVVIDAGNDTLEVRIDGVSSGVVTLSRGTYTSVAALTGEIQSRINGASALRAAGVTATVSLDASNRLVITSDRYGSASSVEITAVGPTSAATLGLDVGAGVDGVDVAGTVNGVVAEGSGRYLIGAAGDAAEGLKVEILGGGLGARGTVALGQGVAFQLDRLIDRLLGGDGPIAARTASLNETMASVDAQREALDRRLDALERRYRAQFNALDALVARLRATSDFLTRQLATLPGADR